MKSKLWLQEEWNHSKDSAECCFCSYISISQHLAWPCVTHPHLHSNLGSSHLLKERRNEHQETKALQIYSEEKVSILCQGELNLSRYWISRSIWWSAINRLDSTYSVLIPSWPCNLLLCDKIYFILKIKVVNQNKIIERPHSFFSTCVLYLFPCAHFVFEAANFKVYLSYAFPDQSQTLLSLLKVAEFIVGKVTTSNLPDS